MSMKASPLPWPPVCQVRHACQAGPPFQDTISPAYRSLPRGALQQSIRLGGGAFHCTPRLRAWATTFEPRVSAKGHTALTTDPVLQLAHPTAAATALPQPAMSPVFQAAPASTILQDAPQPQRKAAPRIVKANAVPPRKPRNGSTPEKGSKRPPNTYALFVKDRYSAVLQSLPECNHDMASVSRALAVAWRRLSEAERAGYRARKEELLREFYQQQQGLPAEIIVAAEPWSGPRAAASAAVDSLAEAQAQMAEVLANYHRLGSHVEFLESQLWNQAGVLRAAVHEEVTCRMQQLHAENAKLWLFAITQHQNAVAAAQALQVAQLQLEVRSLRTAVDAAEAKRPRGATRVLLTSVSIAAGALVTALVVMAVPPGASSAIRAGIASSRQLQQPYAAPVALVMGAVLLAAAFAQGCAAVLASSTKHDG